MENQKKQITNKISMRIEYTEIDCKNIYMKERLTVSFYDFIMINLFYADKIFF